MASGLLVTGKDTSFLVYFQGSRWDVKTRTWRIQEQAVEAADGVNGESRDRLQKIINFYRCTFDCYDDGSSNSLTNLITNQANEDAQLTDLPLAGGIRFVYRNLNGSRSAFTLKDCSMGPLDVGSGGRTTAINLSLSFRARFFAQVPAT